MKYTNINILDDNRRFKYIIEYQDNAEFVNSDHLSYSNKTLDNTLRVDFFDDNRNKYARNDNYWINYNENRIDKKTGLPLDNLKEYIPDSYNVSSINLYFPQNSVESFTNNNLYALTVNTWIHGHIVYLGTYIIDRRDAIACKKETKFLNSRYFEYINIKFIDPWYLTYSEEWKDFRQEVCGETEIDNHEQNNTGSVLNFTLYPVTWNEDKYIKLDPYIGGQNAINISDSISDYIGCDINLDTSSITFEKIVRASIRFNQDYNTDGIQTFDDFKQYLNETYDVNSEGIHLRYNLLVVDKESLYKIVSKQIDDLSCEFTRDEIVFDNWDGWKEGLQFILNVDIYSTPVDTSVVDLGLPSETLWATHNVGASNGRTKESWYGNYYAWGEVESKQDYSWDTYKFGSASPFSKYDNDDLYVLEAVDDAAHYALGPEWRMPYQAQFDELLRNTTKEGVQNYKGVQGLNGVLFTSNINGNKLFIPASGAYDGETLTFESYIGLLWTAVVNFSDFTKAFYFSTVSDSAATTNPRCYGMTIRPVKVVEDTSDDEVDDESEDIMLLRSNTISITQDVMKYFVGDNPLNYVNLTLVDMNNYNINAVNKIEKKIVQLERPNDNKANLIKPVYYRVREIGSVIIHPAVTENICINLDAYKSTVDTFYVQVEGVNFVESARTNAGIIFKIVGANLSGEVGEGTLYILNQDKELITTGKYRYEN